MNRGHVREKNTESHLLCFLLVGYLVPMLRLSTSLAAALIGWLTFSGDAFAWDLLPPEIALAPVAEENGRQILDGAVHPAEEYEGQAVLLQDFFGVGSDGDAYLSSVGTNLEIGMRITPGNCEDYGCFVALFFDDDRIDTLTTEVDPFV